MLLKQMKYFVEIVKTGSFTKASENLYISQSAISQQMKALENELSVDLLIRQNRSFELTNAGQYFYNNAISIIDDIEALKRKTNEIGSPIAAEAKLKVGFLSNYSGQELYQAVAAFSKTYPDVQIELTSGTHEELYSSMLNGKIDMALNDQRRAFSDEFVNLEVLMADCYAEISTTSKLCEFDRIEIKDLRKYNCILVSSKEQQNSEAGFYRDTLGFNSPFLFADNMATARLMVASNRGYLPIESVGDLSLITPAIKRIAIYKNGKQLKRNYCVFYLKERENYYIAEFGDMLHKEFIR